MTLTIQRAIFTERAGITARDIRAGEDNKKVYDNGITVTKDLERYRDGIVFDKVDRLLLVTFIDRILVYENDTVEIIFKYRKEMEKVEGLIDMANVISKRYG